MTQPHPGRRILLSTLLLAPLPLLARSHKAIAQTAPGPSPIVQPSEKTKAGFLALARALRDQVVSEGDQGLHEDQAGAARCRYRIRRPRQAGRPVVPERQLCQPPPIARAPASWGERSFATFGGAAPK